jgi:ferric-dicitrate binding protein FerR (iron transport regulator)
MSNASPNPDLQRFHRLMTAAIDGELGENEQREFERLLAASPAFQREWREHKKLKELTMQMRLPEPPKETWDNYWVNVYNRVERRIAWVLISVGAMVALFWGGIKMVESLLDDSHLPWAVKLAFLALMAGGVILFVSVAREKLFTRKTDKYREIQR